MPPRPVKKARKSATRALAACLPPRPLFIPPSSLANAFQAHAPSRTTICSSRVRENKGLELWGLVSDACFQTSSPIARVVFARARLFVSRFVVSILIAVVCFLNPPRVLRVLWGRKRAKKKKVVACL